MLIYLKDIVKETYTNASGHVFYLELKKHLDAGTPVLVSFKESTITSSSFLNSCFGALIEEFGLAEFKRLVSPKDLSASQAAMLIKYVSSFQGTKAA